MIEITDEIITELLNIKQKDVESVSSQRKNGILYIFVTLAKAPQNCPNCGCVTNKIKEYKRKEIKHSLLNQSKCIIVYRARRYLCECCKSTFFEPSPFAKKGSNISNLTIINVLNELKEANATFTSVAKHNGISKTQVEIIFDTYVNVPRQTLPKVLCIDEVYTQTSKTSKYSCLLLDFTKQRLIDVIRNRHKVTLLDYFEKIPMVERKNVEYVVMDMYEIYRNVVKRRLPNAKIAVDSFHVVMNYSKAINNIRIRIMKTYSKRSIEYYLLKTFYWLLLIGKPEENEGKWNKRLNRYINYPQLLDLILDISDELKQAYHLKYEYLLFNRYSTYEDARQELWNHIELMDECACDEIIQMRKTLINWSEEIVTSFICIDGKRLSNGIMESKNGIAKQIKNNANGYLNFTRYRNRCLYVMNYDIEPNLTGNNKSVKMKGSKRGSHTKN